MKYVLFLRGINVGGKHKVAMAQLKASISELNYDNVLTYINSGNVIFETEDELSEIKSKIAQLLDSFDFPIRHVIISKDDYLAEVTQLPDWWDETLARRDVLFYADEVDSVVMQERIKAMPLTDELVHFGKRAVFWGQPDEASFLNSAYNKYLMKEKFYPLITIRNGKTFDKMRQLLD